MALANDLANSGHEPKRVETTARVHLEPIEGGFGITRIQLATGGEVGGLDADEFRRYAQSAKESCPVSKALAGVDISVDATLVAA
jgi:osmotically inducible protein OsmC